MAGPRKQHRTAGFAPGSSYSCSAPCARHEAECGSQQAPAAQRRHGLNGQADGEVAVRKRVNSVMAQFKKEMTINMMRAGTHNVKEIQGSKLLTDADFK